MANPLEQLYNPQYPETCVEEAVHAGDYKILQSAGMMPAAGGMDGAKKGKMPKLPKRGKGRKK
jgi:hypothetical protein